jgi:serine protease DegQ
MKSSAAYFRAACCLLVLASATAFPQVPLTLPNGEKPSFAPLLRAVTPAVVNISVESTSAPRRSPLFDDPFFDRFFNLPEEAEPVPQRSAGSGVIINADNGYVLTNHHVVQNADKITVTLFDRRSFEGKLIGSDEGTDIALLQIEADNLTALEFGNADQLEVGDFVLAIGNPYGLGQTVTSGIVSALGRSGLNIEGYEDFIQTDASINPGNSGGPLLNIRGEVIAVTTAIYGRAQGIGFAIPIDRARRVMRDLVSYGSVRRGWIGLFVQDLTPSLMRHFGVRDGVVVIDVEARSPAARAKLSRGMVVESVNGRAVRGREEFEDLVESHGPGESLRLGVLDDGRRREVDVTTATIAPEALDTLAWDGLGLRVATRDGKLRITQVRRGSPAAKIGIERGDQLLTFAGREIASESDWREALAGARRARSVILTIGRGRYAYRVTLPVER